MSGQLHASATLPVAKELNHALNERLGGPYNRSERFEEKIKYLTKNKVKYVATLEVRPITARLSIRTLITIATELPCLTPLQNEHINSPRVLISSFFLVYAFLFHFCLHIFLLFSPLPFLISVSVSLFLF